MHGTGHAGGRALARFSIEQGSNGPKILRANDRPLTVRFSICCTDDRDADVLGAALLGQGPACMELQFSLEYEDGSMVALNSAGRHREFVSLREPSGRPSNAKKLHTTKFTLTTHELAALDKADGVSYLSICKYVDQGRINRNGPALDVHIKISTNVTSKQHGGRLFRWRVKMRGGQCPTEICSNAFKYVAQHPGKGGGVGRKTISPFINDEETDTCEEQPGEESGSDREENAVIRRSTRARRHVSYCDPESEEDGSIDPLTPDVPNRPKRKRGAHCKLVSAEGDGPIPNMAHYYEGAVFEGDGALGALYEDCDEDDAMMWGGWGSLHFPRGAGADSRFFEFFLNSENVSPEEYKGIVSWIS